MTEPSEGSLTSTAAAPSKQLCPSWSGSGADLLPIVDISFPALDGICEDVRHRPLPWQRLFELGAITADQLSLIQVLSSDRSHWPELVQRSLNDLLEVLVSAACSPGLASDRDARLYLLVLTQDLALDNAKISAENLDNQRLNQMLELLLPSLEQAQVDEVIVLLTARLITIFGRLAGVLGDRVREGLLAWIVQSIQMINVSFEREPRMSLASLLLVNLLRLPGERDRLIAANSIDPLGALVGIVRAVKNTQILYHALMCLWMLSFERRALEVLQARFNLISLLVEVAKQALKEKVIRMCVAIWRNYLVRLPAIATPVMIGSKVLDFLEQLLAGKRLGDEELQADATWLQEQLTEVFQSLNSFDEYASEVKSGHLDWTPPHRSALFWQDNAIRLEENDCELLRLLTRLLSDSQDPLILSIAASDVGHYAQHRPTGRKHLESLGTKQLLMLLMSHSDSEVRFHALFAVQQYMANLWKAA